MQVVDRLEAIHQARPPEVTVEGEVEIRHDLSERELDIVRAGGRIPHLEKR